MPSKQALGGLRWILGLAIVASTLFGPLARAEEGTRRALLIGINTYERLPKLRGAINDVETMKALLVTRFAVSEDNIRVLTDRHATRTGILDAMNGLVEEAGPQDTVYIHYSGHGSQVAGLWGVPVEGRVTWEMSTKSTLALVVDDTAGG